MPAPFRFALLASTLLFLAASARAAESKDEFLSKLKWTKGPGTADLGTAAKIQVPAGYQCTDGDGAGKLLRAMGNLTNGKELGLLGPESLDWFVVFRFDDSGYVKDDDKDKLDANKMLAVFKEGSEQANKERARKGIPAIHITGWEQPPRYNEKTHNLEWAIKGDAEGKPIVNWNTRLLGRRGVMEVKLVIDPSRLKETMPTYEKLLSDFSYTSGESYAEYKPGDKVAAYGLAALVVGGAAVGAAKLGLFAWVAVLLKKAWKLVVVAVVAVGAFIKRVVTGDGRRHPEA